MKLLTTHIRDDQDAKLRASSSNSGLPMAAIVRAALDEYFVHHEAELGVHRGEGERDELQLVIDFAQQLRCER